MHGSINAAYSKAMDFSFTTSSGDKIALSMSVEESAKVSKNERSATLEWMRHIRSEMTVEGNGLDQTDLDEIDKMMEKIQPSIDKFFAQDKDNAVQETIRTIKEAIPPLLPPAVSDTLKGKILDYGISKLADPSEQVPRKMDDIRTFYEELMRKLTENRPLDLTV